MENHDINFTVKGRASRLSAITCDAHDVADNTEPEKIKTRTYIFPKMTPPLKLDMEAGSSLPLWGPTKTNSLRLLVENEQRRNEVKDLIRLWGLEGKMNIPIKYQKTAEIKAVFNSFPMYMVGLKVFHDFISQWDPLFEFKTLGIFNCKCILTERTDICRKTGSQKKERQIIINRQLNLGPAIEYLSEYLTNENIREGIRYRVHYQRSSFEDELDALESIPVKFDPDHISLNIRANWTPLENQSKTGSDRDYNHWMNDLVNHDIVYLDRLENQERVALMASRNKKPSRNLENLKRLHNLETHSFARSINTIDEEQTGGSYGRLEMGSVASRISAIKITKKTRTTRASFANTTLELIRPRSTFLENANQPQPPLIEPNFLNQSFRAQEPRNLNRQDRMHFQQRYHSHTTSFADIESVVLEDVTETATSVTEYNILPNQLPEG